MSFTDLQNFKAMLPEDKKDMIEATFAHPSPST